MEITSKFKVKNNLFRMNLDILSYCDEKNDIFSINKINFKGLEIISNQISLLKRLGFIK